MTIDLDDINLSDIEFWLADRDTREDAFQALRDEPGLRFFAEAVFEDSPFPPGPGYWALVRHDDVWAASRNPQLFCSGQGSNIGDLPQELNEFFGSMINMDDPKHYRLRSLVAKGFTPKEVAGVEAYVKTLATEVVDRMLEAHPDGSCDFVEAIAAPLPLQIICEMMGIPDSDTEQIFQLDERHPRRRRPGVRRLVRGADAGRARDVRLRPGARRGPPGQPARRHHAQADARRGRRRSADAARSSARSSSCSSSPATRPRATPSATG